MMWTQGILNHGFARGVSLPLVSTAPRAFRHFSASLNAAALGVGKGNFLTSLMSRDFTRRTISSTGTSKISGEEYSGNSLLRKLMDKGDNSGQAQFFLLFLHAQKPMPY